MADAAEHQTGDPHDWNALENYIFLHELHIDDHPLVDEKESELTFTQLLTPEAPYDMLVVEGLIVCRNGLLLRVEKSGDLERTSAQRVRMSLYRYNAWRPGGHNVLRYDNQHLGDEDNYHRHEFDLTTGEEVDLRYLNRQEFPVMHQIFGELMKSVPIAT